MPLVTLTTDFGIKDFYVGALKGIILKNTPQAHIVDLSHNIGAYDIAEAAFVLRNAWPNFPDNTIHINGVNDQDERSTRLLLIRHAGQYFVGWDNGLFSLVFDEQPEEVYEFQGGQEGIEGQSFSQQVAGIIAAISEGKGLASLGRSISDIRSRTSQQPVIQDALIRGVVIYLDSFQNAIVNIQQPLFEEVRKGRSFAVVFKGKENIVAISETYGDVPNGEKLCLFNTSGYLEIAINKGKAGSLLGLSIGDTIQIEFK